MVNLHEWVRVSLDDPSNGLEPHLIKKMLIKLLLIYVYVCVCMCVCICIGDVWYNGYHHQKRTQWAKFKSRVRLFHINAIMKDMIQSIFPQLWLNARADRALIPLKGNQSRRRKTMKSKPEDCCTENLWHTVVPFYCFQFIEQPSLQ